jgi:hypothetical protein
MTIMRTTLLAAAAMTAALACPAHAELAYITAPGVDQARAKEIVFKYVDEVAPSLKTAIGDVPLYVFNSQADYKKAAKELRLTTEQVAGTPKYTAVSWIPIDCNNKAYRRSTSFFLNDIEKNDKEEDRRHIVIHELMHQLDGVTCFSKSAEFQAAWKRDNAAFRNDVKKFSKTDPKLAKPLNAVFGYYVSDSYEAFADVGANLIKMPDKEWRKTYFAIFANTWPVVMKHLEKQKIATEAIWPTEEKPTNDVIVDGFKKVN